MRHYLIIAAAAAVFSTSAAAEEAQAYCWFNKHDYYFCYGPTQRTLVGEKDIAEPLLLAGCKNGRRKGSYTRSGVNGGTWYACRRELESYHNSPNKISRWVNNQ